MTKTETQQYVLREQANHQPTAPARQSRIHFGCAEPRMLVEWSGEGFSYVAYCVRFAIETMSVDVLFQISNFSDKAERL